MEDANSSKSSSSNWTLAAMMLVILSMAAIIFASGWNLGHTMGYYDGHLAGYLARTLELPPTPDCQGKPNCEVVN
jgi:hypothetical protein